MTAKVAAWRRTAEAGRARGAAVLIPMTEAWPGLAFGTVTTPGRQAGVALDPRSRTSAASPWPSNVRGQDTDIEAPPVGDVPMRQRPFVARTIESAIARPSPAPPAAFVAAGRPVEAVEDPRTLLFRDAGPGVVDGQADARAVGRDRDADGAAFGRVLAGVVEQRAEQAVEPFGRRGDHVAAGRRLHGQGEVALLARRSRTGRPSAPRAPRGRSARRWAGRA